MHTEWKYRLRDASGLVTWESPWTHNVLIQEGAQAIESVFFRADPLYTPLGFAIGLTNTALVETSTAATLSGEVNVPGYARQPLARTAADWPTLAIPTGASEYQVISRAVTFTAGVVPIAPFQNGFLVALVQQDPVNNPTVLTPFLIAAAGTGSVTSIPIGNSYDVTIRVTIGSPT